MKYYRRRIDRLNTSRKRWCCAKICIYFLLFFLISLVIIFIALQTPTVQRNILKRCDLVQHGKRNERGMPMEYERITGIFPLSFSMHDVEFIDPAGRAIQVERSEIQFSVLSSMRTGHIQVNSIYLHNARMSPAIKHHERMNTASSKRMEIPPWPDLVLGVDIKEMIWNSLYMQSYNITIAINGSFEIQRGGGNIVAEAVFRTLSPKSDVYVLLNIFGDSDEKIINANGTAKNLWYHASESMICTIDNTMFEAMGSWKAWELYSFPTATLDGESTEGEFPTEDFGLNFLLETLQCGEPNGEGEEKIEKHIDHERTFADYAYYIPNRVSAETFFDKDRNIDIVSLLVNGTNYAINGKAFYCMEGYSEDFWIDVSLIDHTTSMNASLYADELGGNWNITTMSFIPVSFVMTSGDGLKPVTISGEFTYPDDNGDARIDNVEIDIVDSSTFTGRFDVHMPTSMRKRGAKRDVLIIEGSISGENEAISLSITMEADENFEQRFHSRIDLDSGMQLNTQSETLSVESGTIEFNLSRFPFDIDGTITGELFNLTSPTIDASHAEFSASREIFVNRAIRTAHYVRHDKRHETLKRPWQIEFESNGGENLSFARLIAELDLSSDVSLRVGTESEIVYKTIHAWLNETGCVEYNWYDGEHFGHFSVHTYDLVNDTYGNVSFSFNGDWETTSYGTTFEHPLHTISSLELLPKRFTGHLNGSLEIIHRNNGEITLKRGDLELKNANIYNIDGTSLLLHNLNVHIDGDENSWRLQRFDAQIPPEGSVSGRGSFLIPKNNVYFPVVDLEFELKKLLYFEDGNVTINGQINLFS